MSAAFSIDRDEISSLCRRFGVRRLVLLSTRGVVEMGDERLLAEIAAELFLSVKTVHKRRSRSGTSAFVGFLCTRTPVVH